MKMKAIIEIEDIEIFAYHGCFESEQIVGNKFKIYARIEYNCEKSALSDNIHDALSYQSAYELIVEEMMKRSNLLENVANRIIDKIYSSFEEAEKVLIKISKLNPPLGGKVGATSVTIEK